jgi:hypothetical protein
MGATSEHKRGAPSTTSGTERAAESATISCRIPVSLWSVGSRVAARGQARQACVPHPRPCFHLLAYCRHVHTVHARDSVGLPGLGAVWTCVDACGDRDHLFTGRLDVLSTLVYVLWDGSPWWPSNPCSRSCHSPDSCYCWAEGCSTVSVWRFLDRARRDSHMVWQFVCARRQRLPLHAVYRYVLPRSI